MIMNPYTGSLLFASLVAAAVGAFVWKTPEDDAGQGVSPAHGRPELVVPDVRHGGGEHGSELHMVLGSHRVPGNRRIAGPLAPLLGSVFREGALAVTARSGWAVRRAPEHGGPLRHQPAPSPLLPERDPGPQRPVFPAGPEPGAWLLAPHRLLLHLPGRGNPAASFRVGSARPISIAARRVSCCWAQRSLLRRTSSTSWEFALFNHLDITPFAFTADRSDRGVRAVSLQAVRPSAPRSAGSFSRTSRTGSSWWMGRSGFNEINPAAREFLGIQGNPPIGEDVVLALADEPELAALLVPNREAQKEVTLRPMPLLVLDVRYSPLLGRNGRVIGGLMVLRDITRRQEGRGGASKEPRTPRAPPSHPCPTPFS